MSYNLVSLKQVIAKLYGDLGLSEVQHPVSDFISWGAEAVERIGAVGAMESKVALLTLKDYKSVLPNDFKALGQAAYAISARGPWYVMSKSSGNFFAYKCQCSDESGSLDMFSAIAGQSLQNLVELARNLISVEKRNQSLDYVLEFATLAEAQAATGLVAGTIVLVWQPTPNLYVKVSSGLSLIGAYNPNTDSYQHHHMTYESALKLVNSDPFIRDTLKALSSGKSPKMPNSYDLGRHSSTPTYQVWGGVLKCSHRAGVVALAYRALPIDDEGYPLLMDHISAIEAVYWYITMKYYYQKWVSGQVSDRVYTHAEQAWAHYSRQTYGIAQMPDQGDMQGIKNMWLRLVPDINADERGFDDLYKPEDLRL